MEQLQGVCQAPPLKKEVLDAALNHKLTEVQSLAQIVAEARETKVVPDKKDVPSDQLLTEISNICDSLEGEERLAAYHMIWYVKELSLGRHPEA
jgi:hypothetical protein